MIKECPLVGFKSVFVDDEQPGSRSVPKPNAIAEVVGETHYVATAVSVASTRKQRIAAVKT